MSTDREPTCKRANLVLLHRTVMSEQPPNPPSEGPLIPKGALDLAVQLDTKNFLYKTDLEEVQALRRAANFIAAGMRRCIQRRRCPYPISFSNDIPHRQHFP